jgi:ABC-type spermidine/putrescine transport system permease subunit II
LVFLAGWRRARTSAFCSGVNDSTIPRKLLKFIADDISVDIAKIASFLTTTMFDLPAGPFQFFFRVERLYGRLGF